jgi:hypothetical protein
MRYGYLNDTGGQTGGLVDMCRMILLVRYKTLILAKTLAFSLFTALFSHPATLLGEILSTVVPSLSPSLSLAVYVST